MLFLDEELLPYSENAVKPCTDADHDGPEDFPLDGYVETDFGVVNPEEHHAPGQEQGQDRVERFRVGGVGDEGREEEAEEGGCEERERFEGEGEPVADLV